MSEAGATVVLAGASGLVGRELLTRLLADPGVREVRALVRRDFTSAGLTGRNDLPGQDKLRIVVVDFEQLADTPALHGVDWGVCALGTTRRQAGSAEAFRRVDHDYPLRLAQRLHALGTTRWAQVSAIGADPHAVFFYNRVKGDLEVALRRVGFEHVSVAQPSLLAGNRPEFRLAERVGLWAGGLLPQRIRPVQAWQVAEGLLRSLRAGRPGWHVLDNVSLRAMR